MFAKFNKNSIVCTHRLSGLLVRNTVLYVYRLGEFARIAGAFQHFWYNSIRKSTGRPRFWKLAPFRFSPGTGKRGNWVVCEWFLGRLWRRLRSLPTSRIPRVWPSPPHIHVHVQAPTLSWFSAVFLNVFAINLSFSFEKEPEWSSNNYIIYIFK